MNGVSNSSTTAELVEGIRIEDPYQNEFFSRNVTAMYSVHVYWTHMCIDCLYLSWKKEEKEKEERGKKRVCWPEVLVSLDTLTPLQPDSDGFESHTSKLIVEQILWIIFESGNIVSLFNLFNFNYCLIHCLSS